MCAITVGNGATCIHYYFLWPNVFKESCGAAYFGSIPSLLYGIRGSKSDGRRLMYAQY